MTPTAQLLADFAARANRPLADRQRAAGTEFALGRREGAHIWNLENTHRLLDCATAVALAALPDQIRGFGPIKTAAVEAARAAQPALQAEWEAAITPPPPAAAAPAPGEPVPQPA